MVTIENNCLAFLVFFGIMFLVIYLIQIMLQIINILKSE